MIGTDKLFNYKSDTDLEDNVNEIDTNDVKDGSDSMDKIFRIDRADARLCEYSHNRINRN